MQKITLLAIADAIDSKTGSAFRSLDFLAQRTGASRRTVADCVRQLRDSGLLSVKSGGGRNRANQYRVLLPLNSAGGAPIDTENGAGAAPFNDVNSAKSVLNSARAALLPYISKEKKRHPAVLVGSKAKSRTPSAKPEEPWNSDGLNAFWDAYPNKRGLKEVEGFWNSARFDEAEVGKIMTGLTRWKESTEWVEDGGRYIPKPINFLNDKRYLMKLADSQAQPRRNRLAY